MVRNDIIAAVKKLCLDAGCPVLQSVLAPITLAFEDDSRDQLVGIVVIEEAPDEFDLNVLIKDPVGLEFNRVLILSSINLFSLGPLMKSGRVSFCSYFELFGVITGFNFLPYLKREQEEWQRQIAVLPQFVPFRTDSGTDLIDCLADIARPENRECLKICYGEYGSGKTVAMLQLEDHLARRYIRNPVDSRLPVRVKLLECRQRARIEDVIRHAACPDDSNQPFLTPIVFWRLVKAGRFIFLLDAVDEMLPLEASPGERKEQLKELLRLHYEDGEPNGESLLFLARNIWTCRTTYFDDYAEVGGHDDVKRMLNPIPGAASPVFIREITGDSLEDRLAEAGISALADRVYASRALCRLPILLNYVIQSLPRWKDHVGVIPSFELYKELIERLVRREKEEKDRDVNLTSQYQLGEAVACVLAKAPDETGPSVKFKRLLLDMDAENMEEYADWQGRLRLCSFLTRRKDQEGYHFYPEPFRDYFLTTALRRCFSEGSLDEPPIRSNGVFRISEGVRRLLSESLHMDRIDGDEELRHQPDEKRDKDWVLFPAGLLVSNRDMADGTVADVVEHYDSFWMARRPVTKGEYRQYLTENPNADRPKGWGTEQYDALCPEEDCPAIGIWWEDAAKYCKWLSNLDGKSTFRLPNDAQWQRAARGRAGRLYHWGLAAPRNPAMVCNGLPYWRKRELDSTERYRTTPCGAVGEPVDGLLDLIGNVWEWTSEYDGNYRLLRGASYYEGEDQWLLSRSTPHDERGCRKLVHSKPELVSPDELEDAGFRLVRNHA
jgi:Sulfatase-modifying factor enzyme 1